MSGFAARAVAIATSLGMPAIALWQLSDTNAVPLGVYCIVVGLIIGLIEIPFVCACFKWCKCLAQYMRWIAGWYVIRGVIYIGLSAGGYAIYQVKSKNVWMLVALIALTVAGTLMFIAKFRGEEDPIQSLLQERKAKQAEAAAAAGASGGSSGGGFMSSIFGGKGAAKIQTAAATAAVGAAAKTAGEQLFGPKDEETGSAAPAPAFQEQKKDDRASMFAGGSLFGGGKGKYGYGDVPEANPFVS